MQPLLNPTDDGCVDEAACERLGLGAQRHQLATDSQHQHWLMGYGELVICDARGHALLALDLQQTAALIAFFDLPSTKRLIPGILAAALRAQGDETAQLVDQVIAAIEEGRTERGPRQALISRYQAATATWPVDSLRRAVESAEASTAISQAMQRKPSA